MGGPKGRPIEELFSQIKLDYTKCFNNLKKSRVKKKAIGECLEKIRQELHKEALWPEVDMLMEDLKNYVKAKKN